MLCKLENTCCSEEWSLVDSFKKRILSGWVEYWEWAEWMQTCKESRLNSESAGDSKSYFVMQIERWELESIEVQTGRPEFVNVS